MACKSRASLTLSMPSLSSPFSLPYNGLCLIPKYRLDIVMAIYRQLLMLNLQPNNH